MSLITEIPAFGEFSSTYFGENRIAEYSELFWLMTGILISGVSGFAISFGSSWCVRVTTSTTYRFDIYLLYGK